jgi:type IX secretion system substrate protein
MKKLYNCFFKIIFLFFMVTVSYKGFSQCPNGQPAGSTAYDTTIKFGAGIVATQFKFPKFDPNTGMVTCVNLCVTIKGIIDSVALENFSSAPQTGSYSYSRRDTVSGPGIPTFLTSGTNDLNFGPFPLDAFDGVIGSGPDFYSAGSDTVLTKVLCVNISDSATIADFYGTDSVSYNYHITASAGWGVTGGSAAAFVLSSALVNFHFSYCTCPSSALPLNIRSFNLRKLTAGQAEITWSGFDNPDASYNYQIEMSRNGNNFTTIGTQSKNEFEANGYRFVYSAADGNGTYYFRVKQVYSSGYVRFTDIKSIELENTDKPKINIFPNPSNGVVGIKFANISSGKFLIQISNTQGQTVFSKEEEIIGDGIRYITTLPRGMYWLKLIDVTSHLSCVNQLLIK